MLPDGACCNFQGLGAILTVGTEESIKYHPEPTSQIPKSPEYSLKKDLLEDAPFFLLSTVSGLLPWARFSAVGEPCFRDPCTGHGFWANHVLIIPCIQ